MYIYVKLLGPHWLLLLSVLATLHYYDVEMIKTPGVLKCVTKELTNSDRNVEQNTGIRYVMNITNLIETNFSNIKIILDTPPLPHPQFNDA